MNFLIDANVRRSIGRILQSHGHDVRFLMGTTEHGLPDEQVLTLAYKEKRILITNDKDFGELVVHKHLKHSGVVLFRLDLDTAQNYHSRLEFLLKNYSDYLMDHFIVMTDHRMKLR